MPRSMVSDLDYLAARLHGRRSRLAEAERLEGLCRLASLPELGRAVYPETQFQGTADFQRRLAQDLVWEINGLLKHLEGAGADLLAWMLARFQMENIKVLLRALLHRISLEAPEEYLLSLPDGLALDVQALVVADSLELFTERLPAGEPRKNLKAALGIYRDHARPFFLEGALDRGYFGELLARAGRLSGEDLELIQPIVFQEVDAFHLMLVVRGKFNYGLTPELLSPLHVRRSEIPRERFSAMLAASNMAAAASLAVGRAIDALPPERGSAADPATIDPSALESLAWNRFRRLSNRAFRRSHLSLGAVFGYVGIRRVEAANLIRLCEGIVTGATTEALRARLLPRNDLESAYV